MSIEKSPFEYVKSILYTNQYILNSEYEEGEYVPWITNRSLSVYTDTLFYAQQMNIMPFLDKKIQYDYLFSSIRKTRRPFIKYPNSKNSSNISLIMEAYKYNSHRAKEALELLNEENISNIKDMFERGK